MEMRSFHNLTRGNISDTAGVPGNFQTEPRYVHAPVCAGWPARDRDSWPTDLPSRSWQLEETGPLWVTDAPSPEPSVPLEGSPVRDPRTSMTTVLTVAFPWPPARLDTAAVLSGCGNLPQLIIIGSYGVGVVTRPAVSVYLP